MSLRVKHNREMRYKAIEDGKDRETGEDMHHPKGSAAIQLRLIGAM